MGAARAPYMAKTDKERLATGFWNRIESNQATDCNTSQPSQPWIAVDDRSVGSINQRRPTNHSGTKEANLFI